ncbi:MAG: outer membrane beta-barrel protein, partial [Candidatus Kapaibacterium sp.]
MKKFSLCVLVACATCLPVSAQDLPPVSAGIYVGLNANIPSPSFTLPLVAGPSNFSTSSTGYGPAVGMMFDYPLSPSVSAGVRLGYNHINGDVFSSSVNAGTGVTTRDTIFPSLPHLEILPVVRFRDVFSVQRLYAVAGPELGIPLSPTFSRFGSTNSAGVITRHTDSVSNASLQAPAFRFGLAVGAGYDFDFSGTHVLPELTVRFPFTNVSSQAEYDAWTVPQVRFSVGIAMDFARERKQPDIVKEPFVEPSITRVISFTDKGDTVDVRRIRVEDIQYSELFPLVPYLFFPANSAMEETAVSKPRRNEPGVQDDYTMLRDAVSVNYSILDVVCARMKKFESARLTITGTNDGKSESKQRSLSMQRAERIKQTLVDCGVPEDRLSLVSRDLPEKASSVTLEDGLAENRRVELSSTVPDVLAPVVSRQELERLSDPDLVEFIPEAKSSDAVASWTMELMQAGRVIRTINGNGDVRPMLWAIRPGELSDKQVPVDYNFTVENVRGVKKSVTGSLAVDYLSSMKKKQERLADRTVDKFSLILVDFDKDEITADNLRILESKVLPAIKFYSTVKIYGHTDRIGEDKYTRELSMRRAEAT